MLCINYTQRVLHPHAAYVAVTRSLRCNGGARPSHNMTAAGNASDDNASFECACLEPFRDHISANGAVKRNQLNEYNAYNTGSTLCSNHILISISAGVQIL